MLAISSENREKKVEELKLLQFYAKNSVAIFNKRDDKFSKDIALEEVKNLLNESPSSTFLEEDVAQINDIMNRFCSDEIDRDTALVSLISAREEVRALYEAYKEMGPVQIFFINHSNTES